MLTLVPKVFTIKVGQEANVDLGDVFAIRGAVLMSLAIGGFNCGLIVNANWH